LVTVTSPEECPWTARNTNAWITITSPTNGIGSGAVSYQLAANAGAPRTGTLLIGGKTLTVRQGEATAPVITSQPPSQNVADGATVVFNVAVTGSGPLSYQWRFNGTNLLDNGMVSGAATASLTLFNVQPAQSGNYAVAVSNFRGAVTSAPPAVLRVNTAPRLTAIPDKMVTRGTRLSFRASATDADIPAQTLRYSLDAGAPAGASIDSTTGLFTWTPAATQEASTDRVTVRVTDNGVPPSSGAQTVTITVMAGFTTNVALVASGSVWKYRDTGEDLGSAWTGLAFDDSAWQSGPAMLGYGNDDEGTVVSYGPDSDEKFITTYFRHVFNAPAPSVLSELNLRVLRDDGVVVYLNGREVYRNNMPAGPITYLTTASSSASDGGTIFQVTPPVDPSDLVAGVNVVAAEIHQRNSSSVDIAFDLEITATESVISPLVMTQPQSQSLTEGGTATFGVAVSGAQPLSYQWHFGGVPMAGATGATLTLANLQLGQSGGYSVVITNSFGAATSAVATLSVNPNTAPVLATTGNKAVAEGNLLTFAVSASDSDFPPQQLTYSLGPGAPNGATIDPATGVFAWTPTEAQGPSISSVTIRVTDDGGPALSDLETITITVSEVNNAAPVLAPIWTKMVKVGSLLSFAARATDPDIPAQSLACSLAAGAPSGARIDPATGVFTWTPTEADGPGTNTVSIRVADNGTPSLSATQRVTIIVLAEFTNQVSFVAPGSVWTYRDTGEDLGTAWTAMSFDDRLWNSGPAKLGYGNDDEATVVSYGPDPEAKYITTYFRRSFIVSDPSSFIALNLRVLRDDGVVVYLNGWEVYRDNMPAGPIDYLTQAESSAEDGGTIYLVSPRAHPGLLVSGENVVAAEIHQKSGTSPDIAFDLELTGTERIAMASIPPALGIAADGAGGVLLWWNATPGRIYRVQYTSDLATGLWIDLQNDVLATDSVGRATDSMGSIGQRFYRVVRMD
jgi:hypothetical protein